MQAERFGQADHGLHDGGVVAALGQTTHEGAVDFEDVNWKTLQVGQRRVARAEVVDGQLDPQTLERIQFDDRRLGFRMTTLSVISSCTWPGLRPEWRTASSTSCSSR